MKEEEKRKKKKTLIPDMVPGYSYRASPLTHGEHWFSRFSFTTYRGLSAASSVHLGRGHWICGRVRGNTRATDSQERQLSS